MYLSSPSSSDESRRETHPPSTALAGSARNARADDSDAIAALSSLAGRARATLARRADDRTQTTRFPMPYSSLLATIAPINGRPRHTHVLAAT